MILKTKVTNKQVGRILRWADRTGIYIGQGQTIIIPGGYPTACRDASALRQFTNEVNSKAIEVSLITDLPIEGMTKEQVIKETPKAEDPKPNHKDPVTSEKIAETHKEIKNPTPKEIEQAQKELDTLGFAEGSIERFKPKTDSLVIGELPKDPGPAIRIDEGNQLKQQTDALYESVKQTVTESLEPKKRGRPRKTESLL